MPSSPSSHHSVPFHTQTGNTSAVDATPILPPQGTQTTAPVTDPQVQIILDSIAVQLQDMSRTLIAGMDARMSASEERIAVRLENRMGEQLGDIEHRIAVRLENRMGEQLGGMENRIAVRLENRMGEQLGGMENRMAGRLAMVENRLVGRMDGVETRMDGVESRMVGYFDLLAFQQVAAAGKLDDLEALLEAVRTDLANL